MSSNLLRQRTVSRNIVRALPKNVTSAHTMSLEHRLLDSHIVSARIELTLGAERATTQKAQVLTKDTPKGSGEDAVISGSHKSPDNVPTKPNSATTSGTTVDEAHKTLPSKLQASKIARMPASAALTLPVPSFGDMDEVPAGCISKDKNGNVSLNLHPHFMLRGAAGIIYREFSVVLRKSGTSRSQAEIPSSVKAATFKVETVCWPHGQAWEVIFTRNNMVQALFAVRYYQGKYYCKRASRPGHLILNRSFRTAWEKDLATPHASEFFVGKVCTIGAYGQIVISPSAVAPAGTATVAVQTRFADGSYVDGLKEVTSPKVVARSLSKGPFMANKA